jgi:membrane protein DedA with SNARE-associated domain
MFDAITGIVSRLGVVGVGLLALLENVFPPIPSELVMPLAGFVASRGEMSLVGAIVAGSLGALLGAVGWYEVGRRVGRERLHRWLDRHGRWLALEGADVQRASDWFERHGGAAVFFGRLIPGVRTFISVPAGFAGMPRATFLLYSAVGTVAWTVALVMAGQLLGAQYRRVERFVDPATWVVIAAIVLFPIVRTIRRRRAAGMAAVARGTTVAPRE